MNDFIGMLMTGFMGYAGGNPFLYIGLAMFFLFGIVYVLGLPRFLTIPLALVAVFIMFGMASWIGFLGTLAIGLGVGFLIFYIFR